MNNPTNRAFFVFVCCMLGAGLLHSLIFRDMTGMPYAEIEAYRTAHPYAVVSYTVPITGSGDPLLLTDKSQQVKLDETEQIDSLLNQSAYLQGLTAIDLGDLSPTVAQLAELETRFPGAELQYHLITALDRQYTTGETALDLSWLTSGQVEEAAALVQRLPELTSLYLGSEADGLLSPEDALRLHGARPGITVDYRFRLFGQEVSTQSEALSYFQVNIGDDGLEQIRRLLPMMSALKELKLDWCKTSDEAMAQLREDFPDIHIVWRVFFGPYNCLTDTYKIWATFGVADSHTAGLKYCNEVKYLDLGHNDDLNDISFVEYMPDLEVAIVAIGGEDSAEPLRHCKKLEYLEIFSSDITDLSPLAELTELKHLNISNLDIDDITPLYGLDKLERLSSTMNHIPLDQQEEFRRLHPDCVCVFSTYGDPTGYEWRYLYGNSRVTQLHPRYALLRKQIGYAAHDHSKYPRGYVREEINSLTP